MDSGDVTIREAGKTDLDAVVGLWGELIRYHVDRGDALEFVENAEEHWREWAAGHMRSQDSAVLVAEAEGGAVGMALGMIRERAPLFADKRYGLIADLYVVPGRRRQGIGTALARGLLEWFNGKGLARVELSVASVNPEAEDFWRALGAVEHRKTFWMGL